MGRVGRERERAGRHRRGRHGPPGGHRRGRGHEGGQGQPGQFIRSMIERGLKGVRLVAGDRCAGLVATVGEMLPQARYQRCMVHFMRNVLSKVPPTHREWASAAPEAIFAMESRASALAKAEVPARVQETESGGLLPEGRYRRDHDLAARRVSPGAPAADPHEQHDSDASTGRSAGAPGSSAASPTAGARSCPSAPGSDTSPPTIGRADATWTCPDSVTPCRQPTETDPATGQTALRKTSGTTDGTIGKRYRTKSVQHASHRVR